MERAILPKAYEPAEVEAAWYRYWEEHNLFRADEQSEAPAFSIVIPPPNVTGDLHMGHALNNTLQDILCRFKRMQGYNVLWLPGTDHAGIATQNVVERELAKENIDRYQLGREEFIARIWQWRSIYGGKIINQLKRLGSSCDWSRERFTMDEGLSAAVRRVFVSLYQEGLIYRGHRIINWCPRCVTALANLEVEAEEHRSYLYYVRYLLAEGDGSLMVATTRPETMLGDTGIAVHPEDGRYENFIGKKAILPIVNRELPIIADSYVDREFGTGALKITPAHDPNDFEIGRKHQLELLRVIDDHGKMNSEAGPYAGMDRYACRDKLVDDLRAQGYLEKIEDYQHRVGHCYRCKTVIEPTLSEQWFVAVKPLAAEAMAAVRNKRTRIIPANWEKNYFEWLENIEDWCISRQIWWGHRIPAWYCQECQEVIVALTDPAACEKCGSSRLNQDEDVLDTWFSSALWPFSTMGWPEQTRELAIFYPTSVLVTGFDILFFWVARMMMMGLHFMKDVPFRDVYIHALVRDAEGQKMSKSKGNVIDPLVIMDRYGTDAFRFTLAAFAAQGRDIRLSEERIEGYRHFVNKIWNASRFTLMNLDGLTPPQHVPAVKTLADRWVLSRLQRVTDQVTRAQESYHFNDAANVLYQFTWHEFCDWYLEMIKPVLYSGDEENRHLTQQVLAHCLSVLLRLLHPIMPFVTEELWAHLHPDEGSIMTAPFPVVASQLINEQAEEKMNLLMGVITAIRNIRGEMNIAPAAQVEAVVLGSQAAAEVVAAHEQYVKDLARLKDIKVGTDQERPRVAASAVVGQLEIFVPLAGVLDFAEERKRLQKEISKLEPQLTRSTQKLANEDFINRAPGDIVQKERQKAERLSLKLQKLKGQLDRLASIEAER
ncbi:MAG: valine--tRNA ligase [Deltaproteobacteria bacterium]|nr:valine--tRNA ligase [Deltaproteobacteria bacterium]